MANKLLSGGLLGMGGFGGLGAQPPSLLGEFYDPKMARNAQIKNMLLGMGVGLMSEKGMGRGAELALTMGNQAQNDYRQQAFDAFRLQQAQDEREYQRGRDAKADERWDMQWDYNKGRQSREDARTNTQFDWQLDDRQREEDMRAGQQNAVEGFAQDFTAQGGDLFEPGMQSWLRGQGVSGVNPQDTQRYNKMQPYMAAQDYGGAFQQMTAEPAPMEPGKTRNYLSGGDRIYEEFTPQGWVEIGRGPANAGAPSTTINNLPAGQEPPDQDLRKKLSEKEAETWTNYEVAADQSGAIVQQMEIVDELLRMAPQGPITGRLAQMFPGFSSAGDALNSIVTRIAPSLRVPGSGSQSDKEFEAFLSSFPRLQNLPEGNAIISAVLQAKADIDIRRGEIVEAYRNNEISAVEARKQLGALRRASILTPEMQQIIDGAGGGSSGVDDLLEKYGGEE
jgi:hypothetical protein